jgi:hypothetical protein
MVLSVSAEKEKAFRAVIDSFYDIRNMKWFAASPVTKRSLSGQAQATSQRKC